MGLDDYYQACGTGVDKSFHNASGYPLIDKKKFPDMKAMTDHAHSLGLRIGWWVLFGSPKASSIPPSTSAVRRKVV